MRSGDGWDDSHVGLSVGANNRVGVGLSEPEEMFHVRGNALVVSTPSWTVIGTFENTVDSVHVDPRLW